MCVCVCVRMCVCVGVACVCVCVCFMAIRGEDDDDHVDDEEEDEPPELSPEETNELEAMGLQTNMGSHPVYGKPSHMSEVFPCMGSLPIHGMSCNR